MLFSNPEMAEVSDLFPGWSGDLSFLNSHSGSPLQLSAPAAGSFKDKGLPLLDLLEVLHCIIDERIKLIRATMACSATMAFGASVANCARALHSMVTAF
jgi:hypothetical protein